MSINQSSFIFKTDLVLHSDIEREMGKLLNQETHDAIALKKHYEKRKKEVENLRNSINFYYAKSSFITICNNGQSIQKIDVQDGPAKTVRNARIGNHLVTRVYWADGRRRYMAFLNHFVKREKSPDIYFMNQGKIIKIFEGTGSAKRDRIFKLKGKTIESVKYLRSKKAPKWKRYLDKMARA